VEICEWFVEERNPYWADFNNFGVRGSEGMEMRVAEFEELREAVF
jgi:hypothetical protein